MEAERDLIVRQLAEKLRAYRRGTGRRGSAMTELMGGLRTRIGSVSQDFRIADEIAHLDRVHGLTSLDPPFSPSRV